MNNSINPKPYTIGLAAIIVKMSISNYQMPSIILSLISFREWISRQNLASRASPSRDVICDEKPISSKTYQQKHVYRRFVKMPSVTSSVTRKGRQFLFNYWRPSCYPVISHILSMICTFSLYSLHVIVYINNYRHMSIIRVITKLPNSEQSYKGKVKTHNHINRQNQSTTGKL
jgi:hypothetical protein